MAAGVSLYHEEDDDWGHYGFPMTPKRQASFAGVQFRRYRIHILIVAFILSLLLYWNSGQHGPSDPTDWSRFAYVLYATDIHTVCNAYMVFETLHRLGSKAQRVLLFPEEWYGEISDKDDRGNQLLARAQAHFNVRLKPIQLLGLDGPAQPGTLENPSTWETSPTKLRIFEQEEYDRVLYFDSDVLLRQHMDELFLLPSAPIAMPRRYWSDASHWDWPLSGVLMLIEPNAAETKQLWDRLQEWRLLPERANCQTYDDDLLHDRFASSALVLPHRPYILQTSEFRQKEHEGYLGTISGPLNRETWDAHKEIAKAKIIHFNDWPLPKPWRMWPSDGLVEIQPDCAGSHTETCAEREVWKGLYDEFRKKRRDMCKILSVPAPQSWKDYKEQVGA